MISTQPHEKQKHKQGQISIDKRGEQMSGAREMRVESRPEENGLAVRVDTETPTNKRVSNMQII